MEAGDVLFETDFVALLTDITVGTGRPAYTWQEQDLDPETGEYRPADPARCGDADDQPMYELNDQIIDVTALPILVKAKFAGIVGGDCTYEFYIGNIVRAPDEVALLYCTSATPITIAVPCTDVDPITVYMAIRVVYHPNICGLVKEEDVYLYDPNGTGFFDDTYYLGRLNEELTPIGPLPIYDSPQAAVPSVIQVENPNFLPPSGPFVGTISTDTLRFNSYSGLLVAETPIGGGVTVADVSIRFCRGGGATNALTGIVSDSAQSICSGKEFDDNISVRAYDFPSQGPQLVLKDNSGTVLGKVVCPGSSNLIALQSNLTGSVAVVSSESFYTYIGGFDQTGAAGVYINGNQIVIGYRSAGGINKTESIVIMMGTPNKALTITDNIDQNLQRTGINYFDGAVRFTHGICTMYSPGGSMITIGLTPISGGTPGRILYNNGGFVGELVLASYFTTSGGQLAIVNNSITAAQLAPNSVGTSEILDGSVTPPKLSITLTGTFP